MAKKRPAKGDTSSAIAADTRKCHARLDADLLFFKSDTPLKDKLRKAYGYWGTYPLQKELLIDSPKNETSEEVLLSEVYRLRCKLNDVHKEAIDVLMKRAEELGIDSAAIWKAGNYCRELLATNSQKHYPSNREDDIFPNCFGESMYELPGDIRQALQDGHAAVIRLGVKCETPDDSGYRLIDLETATGKHRGTWSRLISTGLIKSNGKSGRDLRADRVSVTLYCKEKGIVFEWTGD